MCPAGQEGGSGGKPTIEKGEQNGMNGLEWIGLDCDGLWY